MKITSILVSQPAPAVLDKSPYSELISKSKLGVEFHPFIKVVGVSAKEFRSQRVDVLAHTAVVFTSKTTIDSFFRICEECRITVPEDMKYFCMTESVSLYLQKYIVYRKRKMFFGKGSFADLMDIVVKHKEEKFLVAVSEPHKPEMLKAFDKAKIKYDKVVLARAVSSDNLKELDITKYNMLVLYSPAEINALVSTFDPKTIGKCKIATLGTATAKAVMEAGMEVSVLAPTKEFPSMVMALENYVKRFNKGEKIDTTYITDSIQETSQINEQVMAKAKVAAKKKKTVSVKKSASTTAATSDVTTKVPKSK